MGGVQWIEYGLNERFHSLLEVEWEIKICHLYREANLCEDALANMSFDSEDTLQVFELCPSQISHLISVDVIGVSTPRLVVL